MTALPDVLQASRDATVLVISRSMNSKGTGFFIDDRHVLTCFHVIAKVAVQGSKTSFTVPSDLEVVLPSGDTFAAELVSMPTQEDPSPLSHDFAFVRLKSRPARPAPRLVLATSNESGSLAVGDGVVFSGYPLATPGMITHRGMVSGFNGPRSLIFVQGSINKGNSGGALVDSQAKVVGIISMREGGISQGLSELLVYIDRETPRSSVLVEIQGVRTIQATKAIIETLDQHISTGIGYARSITFARDYLRRNRSLLE